MRTSMLPICALLILGFGCDRPFYPVEAPANPTETVSRVSTLVAEPAEAVEHVRTFTGVLKTRRTSELGFDRGGRVLRVLVSEGDLVNEGQNVAELERERLKNKKTALEEALTRAREALEELDPRAPQLSVEGMQATLQGLRGELDQLETELYNRADPESLVANQNFVDRLARLERELSLANQQSRRQRIDAQNKLIAELEGQLSDLEFELRGSILLAPFRGMVAQRHVHEGSMVSAGMPVLQLVDHTSLEAWVGIPADEAELVKVDETVPLHVADSTVQAHVKALLPQVDRMTRTRIVVLELEESDSLQVLPGATVRLPLETEEIAYGFWLPLSALNREPRGLWSAFVVEEEEGRQTVSVRYVELVHLEEDRALVRGTLDPGDLVIAAGTHRVVPGQRVESQDAAAEFSTTLSSPGTP